MLVCVERVQNLAETKENNVGADVKTTSFYCSVSCLCPGVVCCSEKDAVAVFTA